jgi:hypothetical protein
MSSTITATTSVLPSKTSATTSLPTPPPLQLL